MDWLLRLRRNGGLVRYVAGAGVEHTRTVEDTTAAQLLGRAWRLGRLTAIFDREAGLVDVPQSAARALRLSGHAVRRRCWGGAGHAVEAYAYLVEAALGVSRQRAS